MKTTPLYNYLVQDMKTYAKYKDDAIENEDYHTAGNLQVLTGYLSDLVMKVGSGQFDEEGPKAIDSTEIHKP